MEKIKALLRQGRGAQQERICVTPQRRIFSPSPQVEWIKRVQQSRQSPKKSDDTHVFDSKQDENFSANRVHRHRTSQSLKDSFGNQGRQIFKDECHHTPVNYKKERVYSERQIVGTLRNFKQHVNDRLTPTRNPIMSPAVALQKMMLLQHRSTGKTSEMPGEKEQNPRPREAEDGGDSSEMSAETSEMNTAVEDDSIQDELSASIGTSEMANTLCDSLRNSEITASDNSMAICLSEQSPELSEEQHEVIGYTTVAAGPVDNTEETFDDETPKMSFDKKKTVDMTEWVIKPIKSNQTIAIEGHRSGDPEDDHWMTSVIVRRLTSRTVETASGTVYRLHGNIESLLTFDEGFSKSFVQAFTKGFPVDWEDLVREHFQQSPKKVITCQKSPEDDLDIQNSQEMDQTGKEQHNTPMPKQTQNAKKGQTRGRPATKSVKPTPKEVSTLKSKSNQDYKTPPLSSDGTIYYNSLQTSSRGRRIKPPLAYWAGEQVVMDNNFCVVEIREGRGDLTPRCSNSRLGLSKREQRALERNTNKTLETKKKGKSTVKDKHSDGNSVTTSTKRGKTKSHRNQARRAANEETTDTEIEEHSKGRNRKPSDGNNGGTQKRQKQRPAKLSKKHVTGLTSLEESELSQDERGTMSSVSENSQRKSMARAEESSETDNQGEQAWNNDYEISQKDEDFRRKTRKNPQRERKNRATRASRTGKTTGRGREQDANNTDIASPNHHKTSVSGRKNQRTSKIEISCEDEDTDMAREDVSGGNTARRSRRQRSSRMSRDGDCSVEHVKGKCASTIHGLQMMQSRRGAVNPQGMDVSHRSEDEPTVKRRRIRQALDTDTNTEEDVLSDAGSAISVLSKQTASSTDSNNNTNHKGSNRRKGRPTQRCRQKTSGRPFKVSKTEHEEYNEDITQHPSRKKNRKSHVKTKVTKPTKSLGKKQTYHESQDYSETSNDEGEQMLLTHKKSNSRSFTRQAPVDDDIISLFSDDGRRDGDRKLYDVSQKEEAAQRRVPPNESGNDFSIPLAPASRRERNKLTRSGHEGNKTKKCMNHGDELDTHDHDVPGRNRRKMQMESAEEMDSDFESDQGRSDRNVRTAPASPRKENRLRSGRGKRNNSNLYFTGASKAEAAANQNTGSAWTEHRKAANVNTIYTGDSAINLQQDIMETLSHQKSYYRASRLKDIRVELSDIKKKKNFSVREEYELSEDEAGIDRIAEELREKRSSAETKGKVDRIRNRSSGSKRNDRETAEASKFVPIAKHTGPQQSGCERSSRTRKKQMRHAEVTDDFDNGISDSEIHHGMTEHTRKRKNQPVKKTAQDFKRIHFDDEESGNQRNKKSKKSKQNQNSKAPVKVLAGKGTLKRKKQIRQILEQQDEGHEDDFFAEQEAENQFVKGLELDEDEDETAEGDFTSNYQTPSARLPRLAPFSEKKTPHTSNFLSPGLLKSVNRDHIDRYVNQVKKNRKVTSLAQKINKHARKERQATHELQSQEPPITSSQLSSIFEVTEHSDSEEERDHYWSDDD